MTCPGSPGWSEEQWFTSGPFKLLCRGFLHCATHTVSIKREHGKGMVNVSVYVSCCDKTPHTGWLGQQKFIPQSSRGCKSKIRVPTDSFPSESSLPGLPSSCCVFIAYTSQKELWGDFLRTSWCLQGHQPYQIRAPPLWPLLTLSPLHRCCLQIQ